MKINAGPCMTLATPLIQKVSEVPLPAEPELQVVMATRDPDYGLGFLELT